MPESYSKSERPKIIDEDIKEIINSQIGNEIAEQSRVYTPKPDKLDKVPENWMDGLTAKDKKRVKDYLDDFSWTRKKKLERNSEVRIFDAAISAIKSGNINSFPAKDPNRVIVESILVIGDFLQANTLIGIISEIYRKEEIIEDGRVYKSDELVKMIEERRVDELPRYHNLRSAVGILIEEEDQKKRKHDSNEDDDDGDEWKGGLKEPEDWRGDEHPEDKYYPKDEYNDEE